VPDQDLADFAVDYARRKGASYAEARYEQHFREAFILKNGVVDFVENSEDEGIGVRVLAGGSLGFSCTNTLTKAEVQGVFAIPAFRGSDYVFSDSGPSKEGTVSFDYDALYTTLPGKFVRWERKTYGSLAEFQAAGYEEHGLSVDPGFIDEGNADFRLRVDSPLVDRGVHIPGINDGFLGAAPDIGAHEAR